MNDLKHKPENKFPQRVAAPVLMEDIPQHIKAIAAAGAEDGFENIERIEVEAEPLITWRFKFTIVPKQK